MVHVKTTAVGDRTRFGSHLLSNLLSSMDEQRRKGSAMTRRKRKRRREAGGKCYPTRKYLHSVNSYLLAFLVHIYRIVPSSRIRQ